EQRPRFHCRVVYTAAHEPFRGFNRAQAAVIEAAILVSRLRLLPRERIVREMAYLQSAITKTASTAEEEAWNWLVDAVRAHYANDNHYRRTTRPRATTTKLAGKIEISEFGRNVTVGRHIAVDL